MHLQRLTSHDRQVTYLNLASSTFLARSRHRFPPLLSIFHAAIWTLWGTRAFVGVLDTWMATGQMGLDRSSNQYIVPCIG